MVIVRLIGWLLIVLALMVVGRDALVWYDSGVLAPATIAALWSSLDPAGYAAVEAGFERLPQAWVWSGIVRPLFGFWAAPSLGLVGIVLAWLGRRRGGRGSRRRR